MKKERVESALIDVRDLISQVSVEDLCRTAEEFFARLNNWNYLHAKPFAAINETPELLFGFVQVLMGLKLLPDMTTLDFGAGSCWTSRFLSQAGLKVIACDVSPSALRIGQALYEKWPVVGDQPSPKFLHFDGHRFDLADDNVDRISCWDAFHHVPNQSQVLSEMGRILKHGGIAGFSEPGPDHSKSPQSQYEMRTNRIIENDIDVKEIWRLAQAAGFTDIKIAFFNPNPFLLQLNQFEKYLAGESAELYVRASREQMRSRRLFFLYKGESATPADSRQREGLMCELKANLESTSVAAGQSLHVRGTARNKGTNLWLPTTARVGAVHFGVHLFDEAGVLLDLDYFRANLTPGDGREIFPGETIAIDAEVAVARAGKYILQCDLVSEAVCWFEHNGAPRITFQVEVV